MGATPEPWRTLTGEVRKLREQVRRLANSSPFVGTGVHPNGDNGLDLDGTLNVDGEIVARGGVSRSGNYTKGAAGWIMRADGTAEFKDVTLYDLPNSMLASPVVPGSVWETSSGFTVAVAWSNVVTKSVVVPDGYTRLEADAKARVTAFHNAAGAGVDYLYADLSVGGLSSGWYPLAVTDSGGSGTNHVFRNVLITGLTPGDTVSFVLRASTGYNTWAGPYTYNEAQLGASLRWMR